MLLYGQDDHLDDNCTPDNRHWQDNHVPQWTTLKKQHALRGRLLTKLRAELDAVKAENKLLMAETESLKRSRQDLVDRIVELVPEIKYSHYLKEKGDRS
tara:strand:+ start:584 stop:880 length:297 start_codon:yes stop_codon:yes gene_type:complete